LKLSLVEAILLLIGFLTGLLMFDNLKKCTLLTLTHSRQYSGR
jgi:hypothetical protein